MPDRILIVDDTPEARFLMRTVLADKGGFEVTEADSGTEALQQIQSAPPDLILLDYMMPDMDGPQSLEQIRQIPAAATIPVIILTARADSAARKQSIAAGVDRFITKPIKPLQLLDEVRDLLAQRKTSPPQQD